MTTPFDLSMPALKPDASLTDIVAATTFGSVILATIYNWGYFQPFGGSLVSVLTIPDLLLGAAVAALPVGLTLAVGPLFGPLVPPLQSFEEGLNRRSDERIKELIVRADPAAMAAETKRLKRVITFVRWTAVTLTTVSLLAIWIWQTVVPAYFPEWLPLAVIIAGGMLMVAAYSAFYDSIRLAAVVVVIVASLAFATGRSEFYKGMQLSNGSPSTIELADGHVVGSILRYTSNYAFVLVDGRVTILPLSKIQSVTSDVKRYPNG